MLRVGLSGGIGSGKSTVAQRLSEHGAVVIDADALAREVVAPGSDGLAAIVERFGDAVLDEDGALNRAALGAIVFTDERARRDLEQITHPRIASRTGELVDAAPGDAVIVHDVPLLVEKRMGAGYHLVVMVAAPEETRVRRLMQSRGMTEVDARDRIAAQASEEQRRAAADVWLDNVGTREELQTAVDRLWEQRLAPFRDNLANGERARRPSAVALSEPDPTWPAQATRLLERLRLAAGGTAVTLDHVGSTAVPGLLAKDVIDLQVGVPSLGAADAPAFVEALGAAGFPRAAGDWSDNSKDGRPWPKRFHAEADPGRAVNVHVREAGGPGWRWALLFRDWVRTDGAAREEYAALKRTLAAGGPGTAAYAEAKEPWFAQVSARAEEWAVRTGWAPSTGGADV